MVVLEHILVPAHDREAAGRFLADVLGVEYLGLGSTAGPQAFARVRIGATTLDFADAEGFQSQHYAFAVTEEELGEILARVRERGLAFYADPGHEREGELNDWNGGRDFYFSDRSPASSRSASAASRAATPPPAIRTRCGGPAGVGESYGRP